jgi:cell division protein FtsZ
MARRPTHHKSVARHAVPPQRRAVASIKVAGVGGSGGAAVNRMAAAKLIGVDLLAFNTDSQALDSNQAPYRINIGQQTTRGLGAGMDPEVGYRAAEESSDEIAKALQGSDMVFITCGLGGGTGTGAAPVVAEIARSQGALTVAVVTKPFAFEGAQRRRLSEEGHSQLAERVDAIITIPNDRILQLIDRQTPLLEAFGIVDEVLKQAVQGISDIITVPGLVNVDFADVQAIMKDAGSALMGIGRAAGENRAVEAARAAIDSPLLELSIEGAKGVLFTVSGGPTLSMYEVNEAAEVITQAVDPDAKIIFGAVMDPSLGDEVRVTVIATGFAAQTLMNPSSSKPVAVQIPERDRTRPNYAPTPMAKRHADRPTPARETRRPEARPSFADTTAAEPAPEPRFTQRAVADAATLSEEELEIPAFLRKKMS